MLHKNLLPCRQYTRRSPPRPAAQPSYLFADYHNPQQTNFGALRVINDDHVTAGMGFGTHPHHNMEIISIHYPVIWHTATAWVKPALFAATTFK
ncbi:pirin family protein [Neisseria yangbaofengii]|uniref:pirin family protein n=1 Tax=Neisseria yangbaofengii TaxID=2709396 RepID=UPI00280B58D4|nr:pirin family protein [Neisseria yangbaofengii]